MKRNRKRDRRGPPKGQAITSDMILRKPYRYWQKWDNVQNELLLWIEKHGRFPGGHELEKAGLSSLSTAITKYHHGIPAVRLRMGYGQTLQRPKGYWKDPSNFRREMQEAIEVLGKFPTLEDLAELNKTGLSRAMYLYYGGIDTVRCGFEPDDPARWRNLGIVQDKLRQIVVELGRTPGLGDFNRLGLRSLYKAVYTHHGGYTKVLKDLGLPRPLVLNKGALKDRRPRGSWSLEQIIRDLSELTNELGYFPTREDLRGRGLSGLYNAIWKRHGGMKAIRVAMAKLGYGPVTPTMFTEHADTLARAMLKLKKERSDVTSEAFWRTIRSRWTAKNLLDAVAAFKKDKSLDAFRKLFDQP